MNSNYLIWKETVTLADRCTEEQLIQMQMNILNDKEYPLEDKIKRKVLMVIHNAILCRRNWKIRLLIIGCMLELEE